jgi:hypothetical protein
MAAETSNPKTVPIAIGAFVGVLILAGLKPIFDSYYVEMFEAEEYRKVLSVPPHELLALRAAEAKSFASAPIPLDKAMKIVARGRAEPMAGNQDITPEPSNDRAALIGWAQLAKPEMAGAPSPSASTSPMPAPSASTGTAPSPSASTTLMPAPGPSASTAVPPGPSASVKSAAATAPPSSVPAMPKPAPPPSNHPSFQPPP